MMTNHKMNLFFGMLLLSASLFVEKAQAMFPERYVSEESAARADTINFRLASAGEAKRLIAAKDSYTANWSPFDIAARLENPEGKREDLVSLAVREVREWTAEEAQQIERIRKNLNDTIRKYGYRIPFPKEIVLVKTTMKDEGGAGGYTRSNWIALTDATFQRGTEASHTRLLVHETFHILTRLNPGFKKKLYRAIDFNILSKEIEFPEDIRKSRISNPDVSRCDSYATFTIDGKPQNCTMIIYTNRPYTTGKFYQYINVGLIPLDESFKPLRESGKTVIYPLQKATDFFDKVGRNTGYVIDPEEVLADNFAVALLNTPNVHTPELQKKVQELLK